MSSAPYTQLPAGLAPAGLTFLLSAGVIWLVRDHVFFWDTIQLGAKQAYWFYESGFSSLLLPANIDSGHPPFFGLYLAALWALFGKSLYVSHWAMLPFLWGAFWLAYRIGNRLGGRRSAWFLPLLLLGDPVFMGQAVLISPDLALIFAFLATLYGILGRRPLLTAAGALLLAIISLRGMMCVAMLFAFDLLGETAFWMSKRSLPRRIARKATVYLPAVLAAASFLGYHYWQTGWIGYHADSPWAPSFERVALPGFLRNVLILSWRTLDYGRTFEVAALLAGLWMVWRRNPVLRLELAPWLLLALLSLVILSPSLLLHHSLSAHRYLLPFFLSLHLLFFQLLLLLARSYRQRRWWLLPILIGLASGNLWIYPRSVAQGWDATLAHLPYYAPREDVLDFVEKKKIPLEEVGTVFPEIGPLKFRDLSDRETSMKRADLATDRYVFYASIMNDFSDQELKTLDEEYEILYERRQWWIRVILYIRKTAVTDQNL